MEQILLNGRVYNFNNLDEYIHSEPKLESWNFAIYSFLKLWFDKSSTITVNTSGSTGTPKTIQLSKKAMRHSARMTNSYFGLQPECTALLCMPATFIAGRMMLVRAIVGGYNLLTVEPSANPFQNIKQDIHFTAITAYQLSHAIDTIKMLSIRHLLIGGSSVNNQTQELLQSLHTNCYESYGMTETCSHVAIRPLNGSIRSNHFHTLEGVHIRSNEQGCLCIDAPKLLKSEIQTTDLVEIINPSTFRWLGRRDQIINSGGIKINPVFVEQKLASILNVPYFISSQPDDVLGQKVILLIESEIFTSNQLAQLKTYMQATLTRYEQPKEIFLLTRFCYSETNKVLKLETLKLINEK